MDQGYSLLWTAWNWDVRPGSNRLQIELPVATDNGNPIRRQIAAEIVNSFGTTPAPWMPLAWGNSRCYPVRGTIQIYRLTMLISSEFLSREGSSLI